MKKIIGILGVAVIAVTMFFSASNVAGSSSDVGLASLIGMNTANAECNRGPSGTNSGTCSFLGNCYWQGTGEYDCNPWM